jgi:hypothetical protein
MNYKNKFAKYVLQLVIFSAMIFIISAFVTKRPANDDLLLEIQQREGVYLVYPRQVPQFEYEYVKTIDAGTFVKDWRASTLIEKILKVYRKEGIQGDAIIFTEDDLWKADVVRFKSKKPDKITVKSERREGVYIVYPNQRITNQYEYIKTIDAGTFIKNWRASTLVEKVLKIYKKQGISSDAILFTEDDLWKADCVKLKK